MGSAICCGRQQNVQTQDQQTNTSVCPDDRESRARIHQNPCGDFYPIFKGDDAYPITHDPKGLALILNNYFESKRDRNKHREGSEVDVRNMERVWIDLGCELHRGEAQWDKTAAEMEALIHEVTLIERGKYDFVAIVIMSHGGLVGGGEIIAIEKNGETTKKFERAENVFYGCEGEPVKVRRIIEMFSNKNAVNLQNIPKLFFFQFCQGDKNDEGVVQADTLPYRKTGDDDVIIKTTEVRIPTVSDILVAYPTQQEHLTYKTINGSWFINAVTEVFEQYASYEHVVDMLTRVNAIMAKKHGLLKLEEHGSKVVHVRCKAMSNFESSLTKKLYFYP